MLATNFDSWRCCSCALFIFSARSEPGAESLQPLLTRRATEIAYLVHISIQITRGFLCRSRPATTVRRSLRKTHRCCELLQLGRQAELTGFVVAGTEFYNCNSCARLLLILSFFKKIHSPFESPTWLPWLEHLHSCIAVLNDLTLHNWGTHNSTISSLLCCSSNKYFISILMVRFEEGTDETCSSDCNVDLPASSRLLHY